MKNLITTLQLLLLSVISYSQVYADAIVVTIGFRDNIYDEFTWDEDRILTEKLEVVIDGKDIIIYTEDVQFYQTLLPEYEAGENGTYWRAFDKDMKKCKIYLFSGVKNSLAIEYNDACIIYGIEFR